MTSRRGHDRTTGRTGERRREAGAARPLRPHHVPARSRRHRIPGAHRGRSHRLGHAGAVRHAQLQLRAARAARRLGDVLAEAAAPRLPRPVCAVQARPAADRGRPASADGEPALFQGRARVPAQGGCMSPQFEPIVGRYLNLDLLGRPHRLYVEEAGKGIPLLCLHTAGSDARQYRGVLNDARVTANYRVIAFDMPWHGKSSPPAGWQDEEYRLTSRDYVRMIVEVADALGLDKPVVMGCSIGGRIVLHLAHEHPERFRALIGLESAAHVAPYYDVGWLHRPDVHGGEVCAGVVSGLIAPTAPAAERWETLWHYMQGGPGVFKGDLYF